MYIAACLARLDCTGVVCVYIYICMYEKMWKMWIYIYMYGSLTSTCTLHKPCVCIYIYMYVRGNVEDVDMCIYMAACLLHLDCTGVVCVYIYICMYEEMWKIRAYTYI